MSWKLALLSAVLYVAPPASGLRAFEPRQGDHPMLIEPAELQQQLGDPKLRILDTRSTDDYADAHIPGAVRVDVRSWQDLGRTQRGFQNAEAWARQVGRLGIGRDTRVVVYGSRLPDTARIWWTLRYLGVENAAILNGGWQAWVQEGRPTDASVPDVAPAEFTPRFDADRLEEIDSLKQSIREGSVRVVDARSRDEYTGQEVRGARGGHIAGATHLEWTELLAEDGRFKSRDELRELFRRRGILPDETAVCY